MALPPGWNWRTGDIQELIQHVFNIASRPNQPRQPLCKFCSKPYQALYNQYFKSLQFYPIDTAPVHDLDRAMVALHDEVTPTIESLCREWQGIKVWPVLFVRYESANPLKITNPSKFSMPTYLLPIPFFFTTSQNFTQTGQILTIQPYSV